MKIEVSIETQMSRLKTCLKKVSTLKIEPKNDYFSHIMTKWYILT